MKRFLLLASIAVLSLAGSFARASDADSALLKQQTQELLDAVAPGHRAVWERYLHPDFLHLDENGVQRGKAELVEEINPLPDGLIGRIAIDGFKARFHGSTAVTAYEIQEYLDYHGQPLRTRFRTMDSWLRTPEGWRLIGAHTAAVLKDPPVVGIPAAQLCEYAGTYRLTPSIEATVRPAGEGRLRVERDGRPPAIYVAEFKDVFFVAGQPRTRRIFTRGADGRVSGFADRREGEDVRWNLYRPLATASCKSGP